MPTDWLFYWMTLPTGLAVIAIAAAVALPFLIWRTMLASAFPAIGLLTINFISHGWTGEVAREQRLAHRPSLSKLLSARVSENKVQRDAAIRQAYLECGYTMAAIARQAKIHYSTVSKVIKGER